uniref:C2HC/C3H-type domain-containing protein n=1 Tax=Taeniopygia guttata TaxID=59729 RepID=A0A674GF44_TAEGU
MDFFPPAAPVVAATEFSPGSQLKYQKDNFQHGFILDKEESLKDLYAEKNQRYSYSKSAESTQDRPRHFWSSGLESKHLISQACTLSAKSLGRQKEGVDRAYPLQPISHHKSARASLLNTRSSTRVQESPNSRSSSISKEMVPAGRSQLAAELCPWTGEPEPSAPHLYRRELAYILKLEADRRNLEEAIQKKKALLGEKLKRTVETLRRIQREKELIKVEERKESEVERTHGQKATRHPEENIFRVADTPGVGIFSGAQSAEDTIPKSGGREVSDLPPLPPIENEDYVACTYCGRKFAPRVAERHIPKCKNIRNRPPPPPQRRR